MQQDLSRKALPILYEIQTKRGKFDQCSTEAGLNVPPISPTQGNASERNAALYKVAQNLEATFLAEMLKPTGLAIEKNSFSGSPGEDQFTSFLRLERAKSMVDTGGIGLAEQIFKSLSAKNVSS